MADPLVETWEINARINLHVLEALPRRLVSYLTPPASSGDA
jgi:hypothetical protein